MKKSEIIRENRRAIATEMVEKYRTVLECNGQVQYKIFVWEDGEIETLESPQGDNSYLAPKSGESRNLYYVATVSAPCFDPWDLTDHAAPEDPEEREEERLEILSWAIDDYLENGVDAAIDAAIETAEQEESFEF